MAKGVPPRFKGDVRAWAEDITRWLADEGGLKPLKAEPILLLHKTGNEKATVDGLVMYDPIIGLPVFSKAGAWYTFDGVLA